MPVENLRTVIEPSEPNTTHVQSLAPLLAAPIIGAKHGRAGADNRFGNAGVRIVTISSSDRRLSVKQVTGKAEAHIIGRRKRREGWLRLAVPGPKLIDLRHAQFALGQQRLGA